ncbi:hypothetical protein HGO38_29345 [Rhizobium sp. CG5]|uniref:hypothetical protein n=1 Tax=Rhizobium sp. CG5 TaxID=2726076 RepID=UPI002034621F|nr:hypothetical protein [Rhizobium sp. CG5]MCM2477558.1 hypothetical protein [Rhizobium sp. CG5]
MTDDQDDEEAKKRMLQFLEEFDNCAQSVGGGRRQIDIQAARTLVRNNKDGAANLAKVYCLYAASEPRAIQVSYLVAILYKAEFGDESVLGFVQQKLKELGLQDQLDRLAGMDRSIAP